ncbi:MAG: lytic transglycosylase domain-containing protein [Proteobacteria bacterium]|nr:MAG: lytic transglycosylase domain-containing protein [Pseudomonadota bacterium]
MDMSRRLISGSKFAGAFLVLALGTPGSAAVVKTHISKKNALSKAQREARLNHAKELLGSRYKRSVAMTGEEIPKINGEVYRLTKDRLPKKFRDQYQTIAQTIIDESLKNQFDPVFLMSVIEGESSWRPDKIGGVGEVGLMQIRPSTAEWIEKRQGLKWKGAKTLLDPATNIRIGAAYLKYLRDHYDMHAQLYLAAYNMGQGNVASALDKNIWPKDYPIHVMRRYVEFYEAMAESMSEKRKSAKLSKG